MPLDPDTQSVDYALTITGYDYEVLVLIVTNYTNENVIVGDALTQETLYNTHSCTIQHSQP